MAVDRLRREFRQSLKDDEQVQEYEKEINDYRERIYERKLELGKEQGIIFDSVDDLVCPDHPDAKFEVYGQVPGERPVYNIYYCVECKTDAENIVLTKAHDCPKCGVVLDNFVTLETAKPMKGGLRNRVAERSKGHKCSICNSSLGSEYHRLAHD